MAIYYKTIDGGIVNCDFIESIFLYTIREEDYKIRAYPNADDSGGAYILYHTKDKKDAENKFNEIINILEENGNKVIDLTPEKEAEDNEAD